LLFALFRRDADSLAGVKIGGFYELGPIARVYHIGHAPPDRQPSL